MLVGTQPRNTLILQSMMIFRYLIQTYVCLKYRNGEFFFLVHVTLHGAYKELADRNAPLNKIHETMSKYRHKNYMHLTNEM